LSVFFWRWGSTAELRGRKEGREGGGGEGTTKENPKTKALGFRSQHAIGLCGRAGGQLELQRREVEIWERERERESAEVQDEIVAMEKKQKSVKCRIKL
jgi:hypothetical protein